MKASGVTLDLGASSRNEENVIRQFPRNHENIEKSTETSTGLLISRIGYERISRRQQSAYHQGSLPAKANREHSSKVISKTRKHF